MNKDYTYAAKVEKLPRNIVSHIFGRKGTPVFRVTSCSVLSGHSWPCLETQSGLALYKASAFMAVLSLQPSLQKPLRVNQLKLTEKVRRNMQYCHALFLSSERPGTALRIRAVQPPALQILPWGRANKKSGCSLPIYFLL